MAKSGKGSNFERNIAKQLSRWLSNGERDDHLWRTSQSGGRRTERLKKGIETFNSKGDIGGCSDLGIQFCEDFIVELKVGYPELSLHNLICRVESGKNSYTRFLKKLIDEDLNPKIGRILIHKPDYKKAIIFFYDPLGRMKKATSESDFKVNLDFFGFSFKVLRFDSFLIQYQYEAN